MIMSITNCSSKNGLIVFNLKQMKHITEYVRHMFNIITFAHVLDSLNIQSFYLSIPYL